MNHINLDLLCSEIDKRVGESLYRTIDVALDDDIEFFNTTHGDTRSDLLESDTVLGTYALLALQLQTFVGNLARLGLRIHHVESITGLRRTVESQQSGSPRRTDRLNLAATLIGKVFHTSVACAGNNGVANAERTIADENGCHIATTFVERRLDNRAGSLAVRVGLEFEHIGLKQNLFQQVVYTDTFLCRNLLTLVFSTPVFYEQVHGSERLLHFIGICARLIYLIDSKHHGHAGSLSMGDSLLGLGHHVVVGCNDDNGNVRNLCTTGTHGGKGLMAGSIEESNATTVLELHVVCSDVLCDTSGFTRDDVTLAHPVEQRSLTVIHMTHHSYYRVARLKVFDLVFFLLHGFRHRRTDVFGLKAKLLGHHVDGLGVHTLVDAYHHADAHAGADNLGYGHVHHAGQLVGRNKLGKFQGLAL